MKYLVVFICAMAPLLAFATDETCPAGYQPDEYIELEYIESTGTQYIDTRINGLDVERFVVKAWADDILLGSQNRQLLGGTSNDINSFYGWRSFNGRTWYAMKNGSALLSADKVATTDAIIIKGVEQTGIIIDVATNTQYEFDGFSSPKSTFSFPDSSLLLFGGNPSRIVPDAKCYFLRLFDTSGLVRDFIPVRRLSDNAVGMYDMVGGKFYGNSGTGEFIAGPETGNSFIADADGDITCVSCPANTYKPNAGNEQCTKCPDGTFSPIGSKELSDCAKILRINDYVVYMPLGKRTEHGLCVMWNDEKYCADVYKKQ